MRTLVGTVLAVSSVTTAALALGANAIVCRGVHCGCPGECFVAVGMAPRPSPARIEAIVAGY